MGKLRPRDAKKHVKVTELWAFTWRSGPFKEGAEVLQLWPEGLGADPPLPTKGDSGGSSNSSSQRRPSSGLGRAQTEALLLLLHQAPLRVAHRGKFNSIPDTQRRPEIVGEIWVSHWGFGDLSERQISQSSLKAIWRMWGPLLSQSQGLDLEVCHLPPSEAMLAHQSTCSSAHGGQSLQESAHAWAPRPGAWKPEAKVGPAAPDRTCPWACLSHL